MNRRWNVLRNGALPALSTHPTFAAAVNAVVALTGESVERVMENHDHCCPTVFEGAEFDIEQARTS